MDIEQKEKIDLELYFATTGNRPQNFVKENEPEERFKDHPKMQELLRLKKQLLNIRSHPAMYKKQDMRNINPNEFGVFDLVLIDPPWEEYKSRIFGLETPNKTEKMEGWSLEEIRNLPIDRLANNPSFVFLWVGSEHLDSGRYLFKHWGIKRCEDVVWIKTNIKGSKYNPTHSDQNSFMKRVKEHCLVGIRGDTKRASDNIFIHPNIDTDVIMTEEPPLGNFDKPEELYDIIERFCLGRRKLELFGNNKSIRPGWVTLGQDLSQSNFNGEVYSKWFEGDINLKGFQGGTIIGTTTEIENLRPKSPPKTAN